MKDNDPMGDQMNDPVSYADPLAIVVSSRVPAAMADAIERLARENCRSTAGEIRLALKRHLATADAQTSFQPLQAA